MLQSPIRALHAWKPRQVKQSTCFHACCMCSRRSCLTMNLFTKPWLPAWKHLSTLGIFPTPTEFEKASNLAKRFFSTYADLNEWAVKENRKLFHTTHKFHTFHHLIKNPKFLNWRLHQNYRAEHFVGQMATLAHSVSFGVKSSRLSSKIAVKYKLLLHLQLLRPGFGSCLNEADDP